MECFKQIKEKEKQRWNIWFNKSEKKSSKKNSLNECKVQKNFYRIQKTKSFKCVVKDLMKKFSRNEKSTQPDCCELRKHFSSRQSGKKSWEEEIFLLAPKTEKNVWKISCQIQFSLNQVESEELAVVSKARRQANKKERKELEDLWPIICFNSRRLDFSHASSRVKFSFIIGKHNFSKVSVPIRWIVILMFICQCLAK